MPCLMNKFIHTIIICIKASQFFPLFGIDDSRARYPNIILPGFSIIFCKLLIDINDPFSLYKLETVIIPF